MTFNLKVLRSLLIFTIYLSAPIRPDSDHQSTELSCRRIDEAMNWKLSNISNIAAGQTYALKKMELVKLVFFLNTRFINFEFTIVNNYNFSNLLATILQNANRWLAALIAELKPFLNLLQPS